MPSFDIVSRLDLAEVDNALAGIAREIATRFDFKGSKSSVTRQEARCRARRRRSEAEADARAAEGASDAPQGRCRGPRVQGAGEGRRPVAAPDRGAAPGHRRELAKRLVRELKDSKLKIQAAIQGDELRVTGKKRDDLQAAITVIRGLKIEQPLQYLNFRD